MADAGLSLTYSNLQVAVGQFAGYGRDSTAWTTEQTSQVSDIVQSGYRQFLSPPILPGERSAHTWSFVGPTPATITTAEDDSDYDMPDTFGGIIGRLTITDSGLTYPVLLVGEGEVRGVVDATETGRPRYAALRPLANDGTAGQRYEMIVTPIPDGEYEIKYRYYPLRDELSSSYPYPLGGAAHSETLKESCLAVAETTLNDAPGAHTARFMECLRASVAQDRSLMKPPFLGYNGDKSGLRRDIPPVLMGDSYAYYNGVLY